MTQFYLTPTYPATFYYTTSTPSPSVPSAPTGLLHNNVTSTGWTESWNAVSGASTYNVYVNGSIVQSGVTGTSYTVTGKSPSTTYNVMVTAVNTQGESAQSNADSVTTSAPPSGATIIRTINLQGGIPGKSAQDFRMWQTDSILLDVAVTDASNNPVDITGATIEWVLQYNVASVSELVKKTTSSGITITDATNGKFQIELDSVDTSGNQFGAGNYYHQARITDVSGNEETLFVGTVTMSASASTF